MTALELRGVRKAFGRVPVLTGVDLAVEAGTLTAILGASGSGKTTLLRILAGFERVDAGAVHLAGTVVDGAGRTAVPAHRRRIGYVPQDGALFPHLTVAGNVAFGLSRVERRGDRVGALLDLVGLVELGRRYPHELSGGQQQRVALARALAVRPDLVLLDEPFSSLDAALRASVRSEVAGVLRAAGATAVLVTHDQDEALSLADRVAVLRGGVIAQAGPPRELYERPADLDLARFLGAANVFAATMLDGGWADTALGRLAVRDDPAPPPPGSAVLVMLRPEQLVASPAQLAASPAEPGAGRVEERLYFGHDTVLTVRPDGGGEPVRIRLAGPPPAGPGDRVTLSARGPALAWPANGIDGTGWNA